MISRTWTVLHVLTTSGESDKFLVAQKQNDKPFIFRVDIIVSLLHYKYDGTSERQDWHRADH